MLCRTKKTRCRGHSIYVRSIFISQLDHKQSSNACFDGRLGILAKLSNLGIASKVRLGIIAKLSHLVIASYLG